jgi:peptidoglycan/xylan/chitin deacetylase (PgdA/CDA1 family)
LRWAIRSALAPQLRVILLISELTGGDSNQMVGARRLKQTLLVCPGFEALCRLLTRTHVRTLMYHRFSTEAIARSGEIGAARLREQTEYVLRHHDVWKPDDHLDMLEGRRRPGRSPVVFTVDDGYADFHATAFPVFREQGIPALLFVITGFLDGQLWPWWDRLDWVLRHAPPAKGSADIGGRVLTWDLLDDAGRLASWNRIADRCRFLPDAVKEAALQGLFQVLDLPIPRHAPPEYAAVTWDQVRHMAGNGIVVGAHTVTHAILSRVSVDEAVEEITGSRRRLAEAAGIDTRWFCYPQGGPADFTPAVQEAVREAGFRGSYIVWQRVTDPTDPFALPRYSAPADMTEFRWIICGAAWILLRMRAWLGLNTEPGEDYWAGSDQAVAGRKPIAKRSTHP